AAGKLPAIELVRRRRQGYARVVAAHARGEHWLIATGSIAAEAVGGKRARAEQSDANAIGGLAASGGVAAGPVCVIHGPHEFGKMRKGAVLVAPFTAPAWTPLFRLAAAVVTD